MDELMLGITPPMVLLETFHNLYTLRLLDAPKPTLQEIRAGVGEIIKKRGHQLMQDQPLVNPIGHIKNRRREREDAIARRLSVRKTIARKPIGQRSVLIRFAQRRLGAAHPFLPECHWLIHSSCFLT